MKCIEIVSDEWSEFTVADRTPRFSTVKQAEQRVFSRSFSSCVYKEKVV